MALFTKKETDIKNQDEAVSGSINMIGVGTIIEGDLNCKGDIRVDGIIKGNLYSKAKVVIGLTGDIEGLITCQNADISGHLTGNISVTEMLFLKSNARVHGDIMTNKLIVEAGAAFTGNCNMGAGADKARKDAGNTNASRERQTPKEAEQAVV